MQTGGHMSTVSTEEAATAVSSEDSSSPYETEVELGLGLSLGGLNNQQHNTCNYTRFLTAKDLPSSSTTSSSSSTLSNANYSGGTKRLADCSQVVGWPPIRAYRKNSMVNQAKSIATEEFKSMVGKNKTENTSIEKSKNGSNMNSFSKCRTSLFVKVNMDGVPIGRKVDLSVHGCYEALAETLEEMFLRPTPASSSMRSSRPECNNMVDTARWANLLSESSDFVLTYEDKERDWMLVGDVPWGMFLSSVKRLRIMRTSEATGLGKHT